MESPKSGILILAMLTVTTLAGGFLGWTIRLQGPSQQSAMALPAGGPSTELLRATDDPICCKLVIDSATDALCLACQREVLEEKVPETSPAGVKVTAGKVWYRIGSPYLRHAWEGMPTEVPGWATGRPIESEIRFLLPAKE